MSWGSFAGGAWTTIVLVGYYLAVARDDWFLITMMTILLVVTAFVIGYEIKEDE